MDGTLTAVEGIPRLDDAKASNTELAIGPMLQVLPPDIPLESKDAVRNTLFEGDCLQVLERLPDGCIDMVLCDLPYGTTQNPWDSCIDLERLWTQYRRVVKRRGAIVLTGQGMFTAKLMLSNPQEFKYKMVWEKSKPTNFLNAKKQPLRKHEDICVFYRAQPTYNPQMGEGVPYDKGVRKDQLSGSYGDFMPAHVKSEGERCPTDVIYFKTSESEGPVWHATQKPVGLARYLVRTFSNPGDLVLDNTFGSGSFLVGAAIEKRDFCGIEQNADMAKFKREAMDYVSLAARRLCRIIPPNCTIRVRRAESPAPPVAKVDSACKEASLPAVLV